MTHQEHRRISKRHPIRSKAAVVFDKADGKPVVHTETQDLSVGGAAIFSNLDNLTGCLVTLLLVRPVRHSGDAPKMLKIRARVVSSVPSSAMSGFRHGLSFVQLREDDMDGLAEILGATEAARLSGESISAARSAVVPTVAMPQSAPSGGSRLAQLRQLALVKQSQKGKQKSPQEMNARVSGALERAFRYLKEFTELLNIVKPAYAKGYSVVGLPKFDRLAWEGGRINLRTREISPTIKVNELVMLHFRLSADEQLRVTRESPADEKLKQVLHDNNIRFTTQEEHNEQGHIARTTFVLPCEVEASLHLVGDFDTGRLVLRTRNIEHFGMLGHVLAPEAVTEESLDELTGFILGESSRIGPLLLKNA